MGSCNPEIVHDVPPWIRVYKDGTIERLVATEVTPPSFDSETGVSSKDVVVNPETGLTARLYRPNLTTKAHDHKLLPLVIYFHGGAFCVASTSEPKYHNSLNKLVAEAKVIAVSVDYRLVPENPLSAAYEDSWEALQWVASQISHNSSREGFGAEDWLRESVDLTKVFLAGDSAGANISHHLAIRTGQSDKAIDLKFQGIVMIHPYFWGQEPIGLEAKDPVRKAMVDNWWQFVCPSELGCDDPLINPFLDGASSVNGLACNRVLILVAENDILSDRGRFYYQSLLNSQWKGKAEMAETHGEDHVFHIFDPNGEKAQTLFRRCASFINQA